MLNSFIFRLIIFVAVVIGAVWTARQYLTPPPESSAETAPSNSGATKELTNWLKELTPGDSTDDKQPAANEKSPRAGQNSDSSNKGSLYKWVDDQGKTQFTESPPTDRDYTEFSYDQSKTPPKPQNWLQKTPTFQPPQFERPKSTQRNTEENSTSFEVPIRCRVKLRAVERRSKKLDKADDIVKSIWLQDYCTALSELIQEGCVVPKSEIKYNRYCPVRYK